MRAGEDMAGFLEKAGSSVCKTEGTSHRSDSVALVFSDNTANVTVKYGQFDREQAKVHFLPVVISDNGRPSLTGTSTLAVTVCKCNEYGEFTFCEEAAGQTGVSIQALVAIFLCILTITGQCPGRGDGARQGGDTVMRSGSRSTPPALGLRESDTGPGALPTWVCQARHGPGMVWG